MGEKQYKTVKTSVNINNENLQKMREIFPQFVLDGEINFDALQSFFDSEGLLAGEEKYGLSWSGKSRAFGAIRTPATGTLAPQIGESKNWDTTENIFIEGDNLEVLKLLQKHYREKIKMIYIDPPYNTGKDFVYCDNFTQSVADYYEQTGQTQGGIRMTANTESNGRYHSDWLTMMYPRLFLARNLLQEDGVIFVSIDDNEVANLRLIMDEIFGEENFMAQITLLSNPKGRSQDKYFASNHEYVLVYSRNTLPKGHMSLDKEPDQIDREYAEEDEFGKYRLLELRNTHREFGKHNRKNLYYPFYFNQENEVLSLGKFEDSVEIYPLWDDGFEGCWTWGAEKSSEDLSDLVCKKVQGRWKIFRKSYASGAEKMLKTIFADKDYYTEKGQKVFNELFNTKDKVFQSPKSVELIKTLIKISTNDNSLVLDFFAGSGTTAQAVMELNAKDSGSRKWICVQLPELVDEKSEAYKAGYKDIAQISRERIRRAGEKIKSDNKDKEGISKLDTGLRSFKLASSNYRKWQLIENGDGAEDLERQSRLFIDDPLANNYNELELVYEILLKEGFDLSLPLPKKNLNVDSGIEYYEVLDIESGRCMYITFTSRMTQLWFDLLNMPQDSMFVCLDSALDDTLKANISRMVNLKTI